MIARFEVRHRDYLAPDGSINRQLPAFASDTARSSGFIEDGAGAPGGNAGHIAKAGAVGADERLMTARWRCVLPSSRPPLPGTTAASVAGAPWPIWRRFDPKFLSLRQ